MAAPHATGALALVMQRYPYLNNEQALQVLLTTATQLDGTPTGAPPIPSAGACRISGRAMHGPGQLLGRFEANLPAGLRDEWSNRFPIAPCSSAKPRPPPSTRPGSGR